MSDRPNILLITTDQQRADHLGVKGLEAIATPALDRLATEGVHFDRAYCPSPVCTPTRVSLLTGKWPSQHGAYSIGVTADPFPQPTIAELLSDAGYHTALFGKGHFVRRQDEAAHVSGQPEPSPDFFREFTGPYVGFQEVQTCIGHTTNCKPDMHYRVFLEEAGVDYEPWFPQLTGDPHFHGSWPIPDSYHDSNWVGSLTEQYLQDRASQDEPWFCWASFQDPHEPFCCPEPWFSNVDTDKLEIYEPAREGEFDDKPAFYAEAYAGDWSRCNDGNGVPCVFSHRKDGRDADWARTSLQATLGMIAFIDHQVGRMLDALEASGQLDNTIIIFTSDHGEMHGHHGFWGKGLTAYEDCQRVPLLIWGPGVLEGSGTTQSIANLVDLPITMLGLAGVEPPPGMQGIDLQPVLADPTAEVQADTIVELQATPVIYQQTYITQRHKLVVYRDSNEGELYDLEADPDQYINLWDDPGSAGLKLKLLQAMQRKQMAREGVRHPRRSFA